MVVDLISELQHHEEQHYHLTFDNLITSIPLVEHLTEIGIGCTGTIRSNRVGDCPLKSIKEVEKMKRGSYDYFT